MPRLIAVLVLLIALPMGCQPARPQPPAESGTSKVTETPTAESPAEESPATSPTPAVDREEGLFAYDASKPLTVKKHPVMKPNSNPPEPSGVTEVEFQFAAGPADAWLVLPKSGQPPYPVVLLIHGHGSSGLTMSKALAGRFGAQGIATLAIDLPGHGDRQDPEFPTAPTIRDSLVSTVIELRQVLDFIGATRELKARPVTVIGYGIGAYTAGLLTANDPRVESLVMASPLGLSDTAHATTPAATDFALDPSTDFSDGRPYNLDDQLAPGSAAAYLAEQLEQTEPSRRVMILAGRTDPAAADLQHFLTKYAGAETVRWYESPHRLPEESWGDVLGWVK